MQKQINRDGETTRISIIEVSLTERGKCDDKEANDIDSRVGTRRR